jgi:alkylation response protein AidB-like acyl-CoA dehydrogenase
VNFELSEEQEILRKKVRDFLEKECTESFIREMAEDEDGYSPELWRRMAESGWLGIAYPGAHGGTGGGFTDLMVLCEEMGRVLFPSPYLSTVVLCGMTILNAGSTDWKTDLLPKIAKGDLIISLALTEPESSWNGRAWDAEGITVSATAEGDNYIIDGTKLFVHDAHIADYLLCVARTENGTKPEDGITLFLVDAKSPGISCTLLETTAGDKQSEVVFSKVTVPNKNIVGELNGGWPPLADVLQQGAVLLCAEMVGAGQRLLEITTDYAKTRIQFDMPIGIHQYVQEHCVELLSRLEGARWLTYQAAWKISEGLPCNYEVAMAKAWTSDGHEKVCWYAHQVHAGVGFTVDTGLLPLYSRKGKTQKYYLGDTRHHLRKVAEQIDTWQSPRKPKGKPLGIWNTPEEKQEPVWQSWRERYDEIEKRKEDRLKRKIRGV